MKRSAFVRLQPCKWCVRLSWHRFPDTSGEVILADSRSSDCSVNIARREGASYRATLGIGTASVRCVLYDVFRRVWQMWQPAAARSSAPIDCILTVKLELLP